uniref:helix-turn-helix domain-containing protein n=1 Tax=Methylobacterium sp. TaxID=409 RepID=UPI0020C8BB8D|nr:helix-turn-helix transcriptional regulator [Methylobacterium sp.]
MPKEISPDDQLTASRLVALRKARGMTQSRVAGVLGVTFQQIQKYERGLNRIGPDRLSKLAALLEVPISAFFDELAGEHDPGFGLSTLLAPEGAADLVRAYAVIENPDQQREALALVRALARIR